MFKFFKEIRGILARILSLVLLTSVIVVMPTPKKVSAFRAELQQGQFVAPFLYPPYPDIVKENSIFDHHLPTYATTDFTILSYTGHRATGSANDDKVYTSTSLDFPLSYDGHPGIDYDTNYLPIFAAADSDQVLFAGWNHPTDHRLDLGLYVHLHHSNNYETLYAHLSAIAVKTCSTVGCATIPHGRMVGISGNTGGSGGPHLHFEVRNPIVQANGKKTPVDPYGWDPGREPNLRPDLAASSETSTDLSPDLWRSNPNDSLWRVLPAVVLDSTESKTVLPYGEGNAIPFSTGPVGGVIVDDNSHGESPDFSTEGNCWAVSDPKTLEQAENGLNLYTTVTIFDDLSTPPIQEPTCTARWRLPVSQPSGLYAVYVRVPRPAQLSGNNMPIDGAVFRVQAGTSTSTDIIINQQQISEYVLMAEGASEDSTVESGWIYIGNHNFKQEDQNYVELTNLRYGPSLYRHVISWVPYEEEWLTAGAPIVMADAVKFVPITAGTVNVDTTLIIDSSGSMLSNDPANQRLQASRNYVSYASIQNDYVGVVDFDSTVRVASPLQKLHENDGSVIAAINTINSSGGTNIGLGVAKGCEVLTLSNRPDYRKGAILLTDGQDYDPTQEECFVEHGWPIFAFGFGQAYDAKLQQIAFNTGGRYKRVDNLAGLTCEFIRVRAMIANVEPPPCFSYTVPQLASISFLQTIAPGQEQATFSTGWPGSDVVTTLTSPSGRVIDRNTVAPDITHENGSTYEVYTIANPEPGNWNVDLYGANVPTGGEEVIFGFASVPAPEPPPSTPPVAYWKLEEGGSPWSDASGHGHDLSLVAGSATSVLGKVGNGLNNTSTTTDLQAASHSDFDFTRSEGFTIETWARTSNTDDTYWNMLFGRRGPPGGTIVRAGHWGESMIFTVRTSTGQNKGLWYATPRPVNDGQWHHWVFFLDETDIGYWMDGELVFSEPHGLTSGDFSASVPFDVMNDTYEVNRWLGDVDEFAVYRGVLSEAEILTHYNSGLGNHYDGSPISTPLAYWKLDEGSSPWLDASGQGHDLAQVAGSVTSIAGKVGNALNNASNITDLQTPSHADFNFTLNQGFSIEAWARTSNIDDNWKILFGRRGPAGSAVIKAGHWKDEMGFGVRTTAGPGNSSEIWYEPDTGGIAVNDGQWHHWVFFVNESHIGMWLDGQLVRNVPHGITSGDFSADTPFYLFRETNEPNRWLGDIDEFAVYRGVLTEAEILDHYNNGAGKYYDE